MKIMQFTIAAALFCGAATAQAQIGAGLADLDANRDGVISRAEFEAGQRARFDELDADRDGALRGDERPMRRGPGGGEPPPTSPPPDARPNFDANDDGVISRDEFMAAGAAMFTRLDANGDGRIDQGEQRPSPPRR